MTAGDSGRSGGIGSEVVWANEVLDVWERALRRVTGEYTEDEWGFDEEFAEAVFPSFDFLFSKWWRVEVEGVRNVPGHGRVLIVANHAGTIFPFDAIMIGTAIQKLHPLPRWTRALVLNWVWQLPFVSWFMRRVGGIPANPANLERLLQQDEPVMVFPEGVKGFGKPFSERYRTQRFGRGGFVEVAIRNRTPIVPVAVVGSEEIYPKLGESEVKVLVVDDKWMAAVAGAVHGEMDRISQALTRRVKELAERYGSPLPQLEKEVDVISARVNKHLKKMGFAV